MNLKNFIMLMIIISFGGLLQARRTKICKTENECLNNPQCQCYCSRKCGFRAKESNDDPIFINHDPYGKYCYCKDWDFEHYKERCLGKYEGK